MGSLRHRTDKRSRKFPNGGWEARWYDPDGRQHAKTFPTKTLAEKHIKVKEGEREKGEYIDHRLNRTPFREVARAWFENLPRDRTAKTLARYESILQTLEESPLWHRRVGKITEVDIDDFLKSLSVAPGTRLKVLRLISQVMKRAVGKKMIPSNPCASAEKIRPERFEARFLTAEQVDELGAKIGPRYDTWVYFAAWTGMRSGEIAGLRVRNLDPLHRKVRVEESVTDVSGHLHVGKPKNKKVRTVGLRPFLAEMLTEQMAGKGPDDFVFGRGDRPIRHNAWYGRHFKPAVRELVDSGRWPEDLRRLRFHDLRHTCASLLIHAGVQPKAVSEWLGHSSITITYDLYGHLYNDHRDKIIEDLEKTFARAAGTEAKETG